MVGSGAPPSGTMPFAINPLQQAYAVSPQTKNGPPVDVLDAWQLDPSPPQLPGPLGPK